MESFTKNKKSKAMIDGMIEKAFAGLRAISIEELSEGFFNAAYLIELSNGQEVVLKIAPPENTIVMSHEKNMMFSEVQSMRLVAEKTGVPVASVLFYDNSHDVCEADYFLMEKMPGNSYHSLLKELSEAEKQSIEYQIGQYNSQINTIVGDRFGYFGQPEKQGSVWFDVFKSIVQDAIHDANALNIDLHTDTRNLMELLDRDKVYFDEVTKPRLVHWDLWAGNVFIENGKVTGLIDFERCLWADELMEVGFRSFANNRHFLGGYGIRELADKQKIRSRWYDMYLFLISALECDYRRYDDRGVYDWAIRMIKEGIESINNNDL
ncbi:aminoglycoside phosphotransferase family protein [Paenibacillus sp. sptzw28]|uniref:phosphotransferase family protein n=1 Tax=Paenibacillus sp. sptzw28 TaxID=715179 RepID=UPI001C6F1889|nr:aminoglycoside phosphotransferase family protein [Paenibacillus sp. sptzw28]QYR21384.1 aminoglycoside phosphotransferase family protein [Paenibacillus sp. sptzw28]